ncbi:MAG TPA: CpsD/CapB family tyrosine-protein kinase [Terriglobales bacterium]|nr:CpsD/CapB family tyrosine-protein kinase [Terriglobales bacterium]
MSYIFDALQKSEAERSGVDRKALAAATEVLQVAEQQAAAEREAALTRATGRALEAVGSGQAGQQQLSEIASVAEIETEDVAEEPIETDAPIDQFRQFQQLRVMVSPQSHLVSVTDKDSLAAEKFRFLAVRLRQMRQVRNLKKVLITSSVPQEGKSTVAGNVACALGRRVRQRTLLIDGDLRRPSLSNLFSLGKIPGLCEWLQGDSGPAESIYHLEDVGVWILPAGSTPRNPLELMQSGRLSVLMNQLSTWFDWIIIDSPPVLPLADTSVWARLADGVLLVTRQGTSEKRQLQRGLEVIERTKLIGAILNSSSNASHNHYYYHYKPQTGTNPQK